MRVLEKVPELSGADLFRWRLFTQKRKALQITKEEKWQAVQNKESEFV